MKTSKLIIKSSPQSSSQKGAGLFAAAPFCKGELVASFDGKFARWKASVEEIPNMAPDYLRDHCVQVGPGLSRDSSGMARYANHSCEPNCGIRGLYDLVAMRDIAEGDEITWDYAMTENNDWALLGCECGSKRCRKNIFGYRALSEELKAEYFDYTSDWLKGIRTGEEDAKLSEQVLAGLLLQIS